MKRLLQFQAQVGAITKDSTNPFYKSRYFDINKLIEVINPVLTKNDLVILQPLTTVDGKPAIKTMIIGASDGVVLVEDKVIIPEINDPQKMGACITYFRRYSLQSILLLEAEDDDANSTTKPPVSYQQPAKSYSSQVIQNKMAEEKKVGDKCEKCGAPLAKSMQGKIYCSAKCWLHQEEPLPVIQQDDFAIDNKQINDIFPY